MKPAEADTARTATPATVVIAQRVLQGAQTAYILWQEEMNAKCRDFPGFEAAEIIPPVPGEQEDFVVVYRFDSFAHLDTWLRSDVRREWLVEGARFFAAEASQHVMASPSPPRSAGMVVSTRVRPGKEREYRDWQRAIDAEAARFAGFQGSEVFPPVPGRQEEWVTVVRFDTPEHVEGWLDSEERRRLIEKGEPLFAHVQLDKIASGFPGWFTLGLGRGGTPELPPNWKQALSVLVVLYPTVMLLGRYLSPWLEGLAPPLAMFVGNAASVALLTWLLMPVVNRLLGFWLSPGPEGALRTEALGVGAVLLGCAVSIAAFLALG